MDILLKVKEVARLWDDQTGKEIAEIQEGIGVGRCAWQVVREILGIAVLKEDEYFKESRLTANKYIRILVANLTSEREFNGVPSMGPPSSS